MRALVVLMVAFALLASVYAADVVRTVPTEARQGNPVNVTLAVNGAAIGERFVIGEDLPKGSLLQSWSVSGAQEGDGFKFTQNGRSLIWELTALSTSPVINYLVVLPLEGADATFNAVYADSSGERGNPISSIKLLPPLPALPAALIIPMPKLLDAPTPADKPRQLPLLLIGTIITISLLLVFVMERKRLAHSAIGHQATSLIMHLFGEPRPMPVAMPLDSEHVMEQALEVAELESIVELPRSRPVSYRFGAEEVVSLQATESAPVEVQIEPAAPSFVSAPETQPVDDPQVWTSPLFHG